MRPAARRFVVPVLCTLVMLVILLGLGTWQVYRLHWKQAILAQITTAEAAPAVPLAQNPAPFTKVSVTGRFRYDLASRFGSEVRDTRAGPTIGFQQIVPLERAGAPTVLVDRGWVPQPNTAPLENPGGEVTVTGYIRTRETARWFSASDDVVARQFYTLDPQAIAAVLGVTDPAPFTMVALGPASAETYPAPAQTLPRPPNNHLSYAVTWYGLALALLVIFGSWVRKVLRS